MLHCVRPFFFFLTSKRWNGCSVGQSGISSANDGRLEPLLAAYFLKMWRTHKFLYNNNNQRDVNINTKHLNKLFSIVVSFLLIFNAKNQKNLAYCPSKCRRLTVNQKKKNLRAKKFKCCITKKTFQKHFNRRVCGRICLPKKLIMSQAHIIRYTRTQDVPFRPFSEQATVCPFPLDRPNRGPPFGCPISRIFVS